MIPRHSAAGSGVGRGGGASGTAALGFVSCDAVSSAAARVRDTSGRLEPGSRLVTGEAGSVALAFADGSRVRAREAGIPADANDPATRKELPARLD